MRIILKERSQRESVNSIRFVEDSVSVEGFSE